MIRNKNLNLTPANLCVGYLVHDNGADTFIPVDITESRLLNLSDKTGKLLVPSGMKNPFKPFHYEITCEVEDAPATIVAICNYLLPWNCQHKVHVPNLLERLFPPALWCARLITSFLSGYAPKVWLHTGNYVLGSMYVYWIPDFGDPPAFLCSRWEWQYFYFHF